jgi:hypothetical protein
MSCNLEGGLSSLWIGCRKAQHIHCGVVRIVENHRLLDYMRKHRSQPFEKEFEDLVCPDDLCDRVLLGAEQVCARLLRVEAVDPS